MAAWEGKDGKFIWDLKYNKLKENIRLDFCVRKKKLIYYGKPLILQKTHLLPLERNTILLVPEVK